MRATLTLPSGAKVRTETARRYVLVVEGNTGGIVIRRSDSLPTLRRMAAGYSARMIFDTVTKEQIR